MNLHYFISLIAAGIAVISVNFTNCNAQDANAASGVCKVSESLTVQEIRPGIWIHTSRRELPNGIIFPANGLIVQYNDELLLIDTAWGADITGELLDWIETGIGLPVTKAIITHFHDDSMGGTPELVARGIPFFSHPLTRTLGENEGVPLPDSIGKMMIGDAVRISNVEVFYPGPAHSEDNLVVWIPGAEVLFGTCAVRTPEFPGTGNTADAHLGSWPEAIGRVLQKYPQVKVVVPGHGDHKDASLLIHTIGLFDN